MAKTQLALEVEPSCEQGSTGVDPNALAGVNQVSGDLLVALSDPSVAPNGWTRDTIVLCVIDLTLMIMVVAVLIVFFWLVATET